MGLQQQTPTNRQENNACANLSTIEYEPEIPPGQGTPAQPRHQIHQEDEPTLTQLLGCNEQTDFNNNNCETHGLRNPRCCQASDGTQQQTQQQSSASSMTSQNFHQHNAKESIDYKQLFKQILPLIMKLFLMEKITDKIECLMEIEKILQMDQLVLQSIQQQSSSLITQSQ